MANITEQNIVDNEINGTNDADIINVEQVISSALSIYGNSGNDTIHMGPGEMYVNGGAGVDTVVFGSHTSTYEDGVTELNLDDGFSELGLYSYDNNDGLITISTKLGAYTFNEIETFKFIYQIPGNRYPVKSESVVTVDELNKLYLKGSTALDDTLVGSNGNDVINGGDGDDYLYGNIGDDELIGGPGNDYLIGGIGDDYIDGGDGDDTVRIEDWSINTITDYSNDNGVITITSDLSGTDVLTNVEFISEYPYYYGGKSVYSVAELDAYFSPNSLVIDGTSEYDFIESGISGDTINARAGDDYIRGNEGDDIIRGEAGDDSLYGDNGNDIIDGGVGNDWLVAGLGNDQVISGDGDDNVHLGEGDDKVSGGRGKDIIRGGIGNDEIYGEGGDDILFGDHEIFEDTGGDDYISGGAGNDYLYGGLGDDVADGGDGVDIFLIRYINQSDLLNISKLKDGGYLLSSSYGCDVIKNIEYVSFQDGSVTLEALLGQKVAPEVNLNGDSLKLSNYVGPVEYLEYEYIGESSNDTIVGSLSNDFFNLKSGDDAADGGNGDDVLDGGAGSNFLTGGLGEDTFFLDGRDGDVTWSTITDFSNDTVNIWGWVDGVSQLLLTESEAGADEFKGATFHYDLNNDGDIDTSITFSGLSLSEIPTSSAHIVEGNGYLYFG